MSDEIQNMMKLKLLAIFCFISLTISFILAYLDYTTGYEASFYYSTNPLVWIVLFLCMSISLSVIFHQIYTDQYEKSYLLTIFLIQLILCKSFFLYLPYIRGYLYLWAGDSLSHVGYVIDILTTGHITSTNYYPVTHLLIASVSLLSGLSVESVSRYSTPFLSIIYISFIYFFAKSVLLDKESQLISLIISCTMFSTYQFSISPNGWSIFYAPLLLSFLLFKNFKTLEYQILLVISFILMVFFHILSALILIFLMLEIIFLDVIFNKTYSSLNTSYFKRFIKHPFLNLSILECVMFSMWILSFKKFNLNLKNIYDALILGAKSTGLIVDISSKLDKIQLNGIDIVFLAIKMYGDTFIYIILAIIALWILFKNKNKFNSNLFIVLLFFFSCLVGYLIYLFNIIPGFRYFAAHRFLMYIVICIPIFTAYIFKYLKLTKNNFYFTICLFLIMIASIISILAVHQSPWITQPNPQITHMQISGMEWYFSYYNSSLGTVYIKILPWRYADQLFGIDGRINRNIGMYNPLDNYLPDHFNYSINETLGNSYDTDKYALISKYDESTYTGVWNTTGRFSIQDFKNLENDRTVCKIYSNYEFDVWYVNHAKKIVFNQNRV